MSRFNNPVRKPKRYEADRLTQLLPWDYYIPLRIPLNQEDSIEACVVVQKRHFALQITYAFRGQDLESFPADYMNTVFEYINSQVKLLSDGWMVNVELRSRKISEYPGAQFDNLAGYLIDKEREEEYRSDGEHFGKVYYLTFVKALPSVLKKKLGGLLYQEESKPVDIWNESQEFLRQTQKITGMMSRSLIIRPLDVRETVNYIHSTISNKKVDMIVPEGSFLFFDSFITDSSVDVGRICKIGDTYCPIITIKDFPTRTYPNILSKLNLMKAEYRWVIRFFPLSKQQAMRELKEYQTNASASNKSTMQKANELFFDIQNNNTDPNAEVEKEETRGLMVEIGQDYNTLGYYNSSIMVYDEDYETAMKKADEIMEEVGSAGFLSEIETYGSFEAFLGMTAGNTNNNIRRPFISSGNFCHILPLCAIWQGMMKNGFTKQITGIDAPLITCSTRGGGNFYFNTNVGDTGHAVMLGPTGSGKSTHLNLIAASALKYPDVNVFIMDYGLSSLTLTLAVGGEYVNPLKSNVGFQPFRDLEDDGDFNWACDFAKNLLALQGVDTEGPVGVAVENSMRALREMDPRFRTVTAFKTNLILEQKTEMQELIDAALTPYTVSGRFGRIFDRDETTLSTSRWILFEMQELMDMGEEVTVPALLFIFRFIEKRFGGHLTYFIMDECWFGLGHEKIRSKMKQYLVTLRKKNVFCIFATQNPEQLLSSGMASTIIQSCPTKIYLADPNAVQNEDLYMQMGLEKQEIQMIRNMVQKMDYYMKNTDGTRVYQLELGELQLALFRGYDTAILDGGVKVLWKEFLEYLLDLQRKEGCVRPFVREILNMQKIEWKKYVEGVEYEKYL